MASVHAKPYGLKVVVTGPESSGKSTLTEYLHQHFESEKVDEYSRSFLESLNRPYQQEDLVTIAKRQLKAQKAAEEKGGLVICDTGIEVIKIWSEFKYGNCPKTLASMDDASSIDLFLLCSPDLPWVFDPLRENPNDRDVLFNLYKQYLDAKEARYEIIYGEENERSALAVKALNDLLRDN